MRWLRTLILFDKGNVVESTGWKLIHKSYVRSIRNIHSREKSGAPTPPLQGENRWNRKGVSFARESFLRHLTTVEGWRPKKAVDLSGEQIQPEIRLYPSQSAYRETTRSDFGEFDFVSIGPDGTRVAIQWETGNASSSHRSMNRLAIALGNAAIDAGVLIISSRTLHENLAADMTGNIDELSGYLLIWESLKFSLKKGLLAITVVEQDAQSDGHSTSHLPH